MRRVVLLALVAGGTAAAVGVGAFVRDRLRGGLFGFPKPDTGIFPNGMAYVRWGTGPRSALWIVGGPGVGFPWGLRLTTIPFVLGGRGIRRTGGPAGHRGARAAHRR
jgi:hypothetical protein